MKKRITKMDMILALISIVLSPSVVIAAVINSSSPAPQPPPPPSEWSYSAPDDWGNFYSGCDGLHQSPVLISPSSAVYKSYPQLNFSYHYNTTIPMNVTNNGHSILLHFPSDFPLNQLPNVNGGGLPDSYVFSQLHFHWGSSPTAGGSEHVINLKRYPAEMHTVHFNSKYKTLSEAVNHADGLAVFAVFIDTNTASNYSSSTYPRLSRWDTAFQSLTSVFNQVQTDDGSEVKLPKYFPLWYLLPDNLGNFYRYQGSLTTPGCSEIVTWTVFDSPITIAPILFQQFQNLENDDGDPLSDNYRPASPLLDRVVTFRSDNGKRLRSNFFSEATLSSVSSFSHSAVVANKNIPKLTSSSSMTGNGTLTSYSTRNMTNSNAQIIKNSPPALNSGAAVGTGSISSKSFMLPQFPAG